MQKKFRLNVRVASERSPRRDWTFDDPQRVSVGFLSTSSICVLDSKADPETELFRRSGKELRLRIAPALQGELWVDGKTLSFASLAEAGLMASDSRGRYVVLGAKTSGHLVLGNTKLEFWVTSIPKDPEFPGHLRSIGFIRDLPEIFVTTLLISMFCHTFFLKLFHSLPPAALPTADEVNREFVRLYLPYADMKKLTMTGLTKVVGGEKESKPSSRTAPAGPSAPSNAYIQAVRTTRFRGSASPFSSLFATKVLTKNLESMMSGKSLEAMLGNSSKSSRGGGFEGKPAPEALAIGSLRQGDLDGTVVKKETHAPSLTYLSTENREVEGVLNRSELEKVVNFHSEELRECYEQALTRAPHLNGKVVISLMVEPNGTARRVSINQSQVRDPLFEQCIVSKISAWQFPKPEGPATEVKFPFVFSAGSKG